MKRINAGRRCLVWLAGALLSGCATWQPPEPPVADVRPRREARASAAVRTFNDRHDEAQLQCAGAAWRQGDSRYSRELLEGIVERNPAHLPSRLALAEIELLEDQPQRALDHLQEAAAHHPDDPAIERMKLLVSAELEHEQHQASSTRQAGSDRSGADVALVTHQHPPATSAGEATLRGDDSLLLARRPPPDTLGCLVCRPAAADSGRAADSDRNLPPACDAEPRQELERAETGLAAGRIGEAADCLEQAVALAGDAETANAAAVLALKHAQTALSADLATRAISSFPHSAVLYRTLGTAQYRLGRYGEAQVSLSQALSLDSANPLAYFLLGCTLARLGQAEDAQWHFQQAARLDNRYADQVRPTR